MKCEQCYENEAFYAHKEYESVFCRSCAMDIDQDNGPHNVLYYP
jgi:hypothetical protein